jgi:ribosome production factor 2
MQSQGVVKPKNRRVKRALEARAPKLIENTKSALFVRGGHTSETVTQALKDVSGFKKPHAVMLRRKNILRPFEDPTSLEFLSQKSDASLFVFGSHSKKRPHNLVVGRMYDHHILDMIELGIENFKPFADFKSKSCVLGSKPCLIFSGDLFETEVEYVRLKNIFIDFFRGEELTKLSLGGVDHVISFTAAEGHVYFRAFQLSLKKSGSKTPRVEVEEMGPSLDLVLRRSRLADDSLYKQACRKPAATKPKKVKNVSRDPFGSKLGQVHMKRQDFSQLQTRKMKGLKRTKPRTTSDQDRPQTTKKVKLDSIS